MVKENEIEEILKNAGIEKFGFVDKTIYDKQAPSGHRIADLLPTARSALVSILPLNREVVDRFPHDFEGDSYEAYVLEKKKVTERLLEAGNSVAAALRDHGFSAMIVPKGSRKYMGPVSLKHLGYFAGLGVFGRNSLLLNPVYGPCLRIGAVLTEYVPSEVGTIMNMSICRDCSRCIAACPAHALELPQKREVYRVSKEGCHSYFCKMRHVEHGSENVNVECGLCMQACPVGRAGKRGGR